MVRLSPAAASAEELKNVGVCQWAFDMSNSSLETAANRQVGAGSLQVLCDMYIMTCSLVFAWD